MAKNNNNLHFLFLIWIKPVGGLNIGIQCPRREHDFAGLQNSKHICRYSKEGVIQQLRGQNFAQLWPPTPLTIGDILHFYPSFVHLTKRGFSTDSLPKSTFISLINMTSRLPILKNSTLLKSKIHPTRL